MMKHAGEGAAAWDWEQPVVQEVVAKLTAEYDSQLLLLIGLMCLMPFCGEITPDREQTENERSAGLRVVHLLGEFQLSNERGIRAMWVTVCGLVAGIWAKEQGAGASAGSRLASVAYAAMRKRPGRDRPGPDPSGGR